MRPEHINNFLMKVLQNRRALIAGLAFIFGGLALKILSVEKSVMAGIRIVCSEVGDWDGATLLIFDDPLTADLSSKNYLAIHDQIASQVKSKRDRIVHGKIRAGEVILPPEITAPFTVIRFGKLWMFFETFEMVDDGKVIMSKDNVFVGEVE